MSIERMERKEGTVVWRVRWRQRGHNHSKVLGRKPRVPQLVGERLIGFVRRGGKRSGRRRVGAKAVVVSGSEQQEESNRDGLCGRKRGGGAEEVVTGRKSRSGSRRVGRRAGAAGHRLRSRSRAGADARSPVLARPRCLPATPLCLRNGTARHRRCATRARSGGGLAVPLPAARRSDLGRLAQSRPGAPPAGRRAPRLQPPLRRAARGVDSH